MKIKGHTDIILTNVKTGEVERHSDDNMLTNAIAEYLASCGFLNANNVDQDNMVVKLLGGVMAFDEAISESATQVFAPDDLEMIANGSVGVDNVSEVLELGSYSETESGWQQDGSYVQTYDYSTTQGNGTIACVCLTGQDFGYVGEGNSLSGEVMESRRNLTQYGTVTQYTINGVPCRLDFANSTIYGVDFSDIGNNNVTIRKYRLPVTKVNLKGTKTAPVILSETTIQAPTALVDELTKTGYVTLPSMGDGSIQDVDGHLMILKRNDDPNAWGNGFTQYLWDIDVVNATIAESTLVNSSGETLHSICYPVWLTKDRIAFIDGWDGYSYQAKKYGQYVYSMQRTNGTWGSMQKCSNPIGATAEQGQRNCGWNCKIRSSSKRAVVDAYGYMVIFDFAKNKVYTTNGGVNYTQMPSYNMAYDKPLIKYMATGATALQPHVIYVCRDETYIATINNLATPVQKTPEKTMKIVYRLTFTDQ